jgi:hypothetical protein
MAFDARAARKFRGAPFGRGRPVGSARTSPIRGERLRKVTAPCGETGGDPAHNLGGPGSVRRFPPRPVGALSRGRGRRAARRTWWVALA